VAPFVRSLTTALATCLLVAGRASGAGAPGDDAFSMMSEQTVTGATKRPLPLSEAPSSVTVIPSVEIRAMGYHTLSDALRYVRGLFVTYDGNYAYLGVRGVQRPGDYNNKILLSIDGHTMNGSVYADAFIGPELGLGLEEVERIEVVRGPGSATYGSYAVLAVVNVVTRKASSKPAVSASLRAGGPSEYLGQASVASSRPGWPELHVSASWLQSEGLPHDYYDPAVYALPVSMHDGERAGSIFGAVAWKGFELTGKYNLRRKDTPPASYGLVEGDIPSSSWDGHDYVELSNTTPLGTSLDLSSRVYWDFSSYKGR
jgi:outer membrane cobalamin receptor